MEDAPHVMLRAFEKLILFPLALVTFVAGLITLYEKYWLLGAFFVFISLCFSVIGQGLPHRKKQTSSELYLGTVGERYGIITPEESWGFARALIKTGFLVGAVAVACALHRDLNWYWIVGYALFSYFGFILATIATCIFWAWLMKKMYGKPQQS